MKNVLLLAPAVAAHAPLTGPLAERYALGIGAFCAAASATYLINDLVDRPHDRTHRSKRRRPIAAGILSARAALGAAVALAAVAAVIASALPETFVEVLGAYAVTSIAYSLILKKTPLIDVMALAALYSLRVFAGAILGRITLSGWFLAFFAFLFVGLALTKRVAELAEREETAGREVEGRGYRVGDAPLLVGLGAACGIASALVYSLYITGPTVAALYTKPQVLWAGLPPLLYWQARLLLKASRGEMGDDPVMFALGDAASYVVAAVMAAAVTLAA